MFQTKVEIPSSKLKIDYENSIMTLGSCFAENIGKKMQEVYFKTDFNPFGVLYNPVSIKNSIDLLLGNKKFTSADIFEYKGLWQSFSHSSAFSDTSAEGCLDRINDRFEKSSALIRQTDVLMLTFGTAWVYEEKESGYVVSNCHKLPADRFNRRRLEVGEIVDAYNCLVCSLMNTNPELQIILSVSPIRHLKDGATENSVSKSTLLLAVSELQEQFENIHYFPAYEIMMDELRDYRFYASDMFHPSDVAVEYIWQRFSETYFDQTTLKMKKEFEQLVADLSHRPLFPESDEFQKFQINLLKRQMDLKTRYPFLNSRI